LLLLLLGTPVDSNGDDLPSHSGDAPAATQLPNDGKSQWYPFESQANFELADFIFHQNEMPGAQIDELMHIWASMPGHQGPPPICQP